MTTLNKCLSILAASLALCAFGAQAADCDAQAAEKKLAGAAKTSFLKKCMADAGGAVADSACGAKAAEKKLAGAAKTAFLKKCTADAAAGAVAAPAAVASAVSGAEATCAAKAAEKKLAGAAKTAFTKKCVADASK